MRGTSCAFGTTGARPRLAARAHTLVRTHAQTHTRTLMRPRAHTYTRAHTCAHTLVRTHSCEHTHTRAHVHTLVRTLVHHARTHKHTLVRTHAHTYTHAHTRAHTRALVRSRVHAHAHCSCTCVHPATPLPQQAPDRQGPLPPQWPSATHSPAGSIGRTAFGFRRRCAGGARAHHGGAARSAADAVVAHVPRARVRRDNTQHAAYTRRRRAAFPTRSRLVGSLRGCAARLSGWG